MSWLKTPPLDPLQTPALSWREDCVNDSRFAAYTRYAPGLNPLNTLVYQVVIEEMSRGGSVTATLLKGSQAQAASTLGVDAAAALQNLGRSRLR